MNILMVAPEAAPYLRMSDVANVVTGLSTALRKKGHDVRIAIPQYRNLVVEPILTHRRLVVFPVGLGAYTRQVHVDYLSHPEALSCPPVYLIGNDFYFDRDNPYGYLDDYERVIFFTRAFIEMLGNPGFQSEGWQPEVIHGHDWIAGLLPMCLQHTYKEYPAISSTAFVYTIHNRLLPQ